MCILALQVGDRNNPLIIASNRDEYFERPTINGKVDREKQVYFPLDEEAGGTWIAIGNLNGRYAVILNFHTWRPTGNEAHYNCVADDENLTALSRGRIIMDYISSESGKTAESFIAEIDFKLYRGFNLIIGDIFGCFYVSNCVQQKIVRLQPGEIYCVSNGPLEDWPKSRKLSVKVRAILENYRGHPYTEETAEVLSGMLLESMLDETPLPDPILDMESEMHSKVAAIFNVPMYIDQDKSKGLHGTRTITIAVSYAFGIQEQDSDHKLDGSGKGESTPDPVVFDRIRILEKDWDTTSGSWRTAVHTMPFNHSI